MAYFQSWRFLNQVSLVICFLQLIIFLIIYYLAQVHFAYLSGIMRSIQAELLESINANQNKILLETYADSCKYGLLRSQLKLMSADRLNHFIQQQDIVIANPQLCLVPPYMCDNYALNQTYTYAFMNRSANQLPQNELDRQAMKLSAMLTYTQTFLDQDIYLFFTTSSDSLYWSVMPGTNYRYVNPHQIIWYLNNSQERIDNPNNTYYSDPYISGIFKTYFIANTKALTNLKYQSQGVLATGINFNLFQFYQLHNQTIQIIDKYGKLLLQKDDTLNPQYIYNASITGYDHDDFLDLIKFNINSSSFSCQIEDIKFSKTLCLYNQLTQKEMIVSQKVLRQSGFNIIITQDLSYTAQQIRINLGYFAYQINSIQQAYLIIDFTVIIFSIILSIILIYLVLNRIHQLENFIEEYFRGGLASKIRRRDKLIQIRAIIDQGSDQLEQLKYRILCMHDKTQFLSKCPELIQAQELFEYAMQDFSYRTVFILSKVLEGLLIHWITESRVALKLIMNIIRNQNISYIIVDEFQQILRIHSLKRQLF